MNQLAISFSSYKSEHFHNTIDLEGEALYKADQSAKSLEERVYNLMKDGKARSAPEVQRDIDGTPLIGSVRRALSNLTTEKFGDRLVKTKETSPGLYQYRNYRYKLNKKV